jgi:hypothetical protein
LGRGGDGGGMRSDPTSSPCVTSSSCGFPSVAWCGLGRSRRWGWPCRQARRNELSRVRIERFYLEGAGPSALVVGLPGGVGLVLEPTAAAVRRVWTGDFPDLAPVRPGAGKLLDAVTLPGVVRFRDAGEAPVRPGDARRVPTVLFQGYTWAEDRVALRYRIDGQDVTDHLRVLPGGAGVERRWDTGNDRSVWSHVSEAGEVRTLARDEQGRLVLDLVWERVAP